MNSGARVRLDGPRGSSAREDCRSYRRRRATRRSAAEHGGSACASLAVAKLQPWLAVRLVSFPRAPAPLTVAQRTTIGSSPRRSGTCSLASLRASPRSRRTSPAASLTLYRLQWVTLLIPSRFGCRPRVLGAASRVPSCVPLAWLALLNPAQHALSVTVRTEGIRGLYKGAFPPLVPSARTAPRCE